MLTKDKHLCMSMLTRGVNTCSAYKMATSSQGAEKGRMAAVQLSARLKNCWSLDINWDLCPPFIREVSLKERKLDFV